MDDLNTGVDYDPLAAEVDDFGEIEHQQAASVVLSEEALTSKLGYVDILGGGLEVFELLSEVVGGVQAIPELLVDLLDNALLFLDYCL